MPNVDTYEREVLTAFEKGKLKSLATKAELEKFKAAARATAVKDRRVNIRLSSIDLNDIQVRRLKKEARTSYRSAAFARPYCPKVTFDHEHS